MIDLILGDARELAESKIATGSVDLIFTDPPYLKEYLWCYGWLAQEAKRILKPGGFCLAMCGGIYLDKIVEAMSEHLTFFWKFEVMLTSRAAVWRRPGQVIITGSKPILAYSNGEGSPA